MFKKVNNNLYVVDGSDVNIIDTAVNGMVNSTTPVSKGVFNISINDNLYETILSRYIAGEFITKHGDIIKKEQHVVVSIGVNNKNYKITIGNLSNTKEPEFIHGIMTT
jgi:hypothetical protein